MSTSKTPQWGNVIWINFDPKRGHEQAGQRPALVLSNSRYNAITGLCIVCPITTQVKKYPTEVALPKMKTKGVVLTGQIRTLDWESRGFRFREKAPPNFVKEVIKFVTTLFQEDEALDE